MTISCDNTRFGAMLFSNSIKRLRACVIVITWLFCGRSPGDDTQIVSEIKSAWSARRTRYKSIECSFSSKHSQGIPIKIDTNVAMTKKEPKTVTFVNSTRMLIAGDRLSYSLKGDTLGEEGVLYKRESIDTSNGNVSKHLAMSNESIAYPSGQIYNHAVNACATLADTLPLRWTFFPLDPKTSGFDLDKLSLYGYGTIDSRKCLIYQDGAPKRAYYWIDPSRDYSVLRYALESSGKTVFQAECSYKLDRTRLWIPNTWIVSHLAPDGSPVATSVSTMQGYHTDVDVSDGDFDIEFPVGSIVSDARPQPGIGRTDTLDYLVMEDRSKRIITWDERTASYDELMQTASGEAGLRTVKSGNRWFFYINVALVSGIAIVIVRRWLIKKKHVGS